jgi:tetratricopeptide (TPR) repeat protein
VRGRNKILHTLEKILTSGGKAQILAGMAGVGKSTLALALCSRALRNRRFRKYYVWWVPATDSVSLTAGMLNIARQLGATDQDLVLIEQDAASAIHRFWELLEGASSRWLLVLDNADYPALLANREYDSAVSDGTGWVRISHKGLVVVTTRVSDASVWGRQCQLHTVDLLDKDDSCQVLLDAASNAGDAEAARKLAERLGNLPLALSLAGGAISSGYTQWRTFQSFLQRMDESGPALLMLDPDVITGEPRRATVLTTWEISLDALSESLPASRALLRIIACFASATPIPIDLLNADLLKIHFPALFVSESGEDSDLILQQHLRGLARVQLIDIQMNPGGDDSVLIHSLIAETSRVHTARQTDIGWTSQEMYQAATRLICTKLQSLKSGDDPDTWPSWRSLIPHLRALITVADGNLSSDYADDLLRAVYIAIQFFWWSGNPWGGEELGELALTMLTSSSAHSAAFLAVRGEVALASGDLRGWKEQEEIFRSLVDDGTISGLSDTPELLRIRQNWAECLRENGRLEEAESEYRSVLAGRERLLGANHRDTLDSLHELGRTMARQGRHSEALAIFENLVPARQRALGINHPRTLAARHELASELGQLGFISRALAEMNTVADSRTAVLGPNNFGALDSRRVAARLNGQQGQFESAVRELIAIRQTLDELCGPDNSKSLRVTHDLGEIYELAGRLDEAETEFRRAMAGRELALGVDHHEYIESKDAHSSICRRMQPG